MNTGSATDRRGYNAMRDSVSALALICFLTLPAGCSRSDNAELAKAKAEAEAARAEVAVAKAELAKSRAEKGEKGAGRAGGKESSKSASVQRDDGKLAKQSAKKQVGLKDHLGYEDMVSPINQFDGYETVDYHNIPNCLGVFAECVAVTSDGKTEAQYKSAVDVVARKPCRMVLKVVQVSANYDYADFALLKDNGEAALDVLKQAGDLGGYTKHLRDRFAINNVKVKGFDAKNRSIGDQVVLVGLGHVGDANSWGARDPRHGMPRGDERYVMLRAFGSPDGGSRSGYEFAFMIRNWYIAKQ